jgi:hypothetical protein
VTKPVLRLAPLPASLALVCTAVGAVVVIGFATVALMPVLLFVGFVAAWLLAALLVGWAGIEGLAALERWFENDPRFQR